MGIGPFEILIVLAVLALIIGPRRVTNMARSLGRGVQDFVSEFGDKKSVGSQPPALGEGEEGDAEDEDRRPSNTSDKS